MENSKSITDKKLIQWSDKFVLDNSVVDEQHKCFLSLVNEFYFALSIGKANEEIAGTIIMLQTYSQNHFKTEEKFLNQINYNDIEQHNFAYETFKITVDELEERYKSKEGIDTLAFDIMDFIKNWFQNHTLPTCKKIKTFYKNKKITNQL